MATVTICSGQGSYSSAYALLTVKCTSVSRINASTARASLSWSISKKSSTSYNQNKYMHLVTSGTGSDSVSIGHSAALPELSKSTSGLTSLSGTTTIDFDGNSWNTTSRKVACAISASSSSVSSSGTLVFNGKTNTNTSPKDYQYATISFGAYSGTVTPAVGSYVASVSGGGTGQIGSSTTVSCTLGSYTGYTTSWSSWVSNNTSLISSGGSQSRTVTIPNGSVTLTATATRSAKSYSLKLTAGDYISAVSGGGTKSYNASVTIDATLASYTGYTTSWSSWKNGSSVYTYTKKYTFNMPASDLTLTAYGTRAVNSYTLTVAKGDNIASVSGGGTKTYGQSCSATCSVASSTGYTTTFSKWTSSNTSLLSNSTASTYSFTMPAGSVTLTASASKSINSYTLNTVRGANIASTNNGGTISTSTNNSNSYTYNSNVSINCELENVEGYTTTFDKWASSNVSLVPNISTKLASVTIPAANITLTASALRSVNYYTLSCVKGDYISSVTGGGSVAYGSSNNISATLSSASGYTISFSNWISNNGGTFNNSRSLSTSFTMPIGNTTVTAQATRTANTYIVTFDPSPGTLVNGSPTSKVVTFDSAYGSLPACSDLINEQGLIYARFYGWSTVKDDSTKVVTTESIVSIANNHKLYAIYNYSNYTFLWIDGGKVGDRIVQSTEAYSYGDPVSAVRTLSGEDVEAKVSKGWKFQGYYTGVGGTGIKYFSGSTSSQGVITATPIVNIWNNIGDITLYACWTTTVKYKVRRSSNLTVRTSLEEVVYTDTDCTYNSNIQLPSSTFIVSVSDNPNYLFSKWAIEESTWNSRSSRFNFPDEVDSTNFHEVNSLFNTALFDNYANIAYDSSSDCYILHGWWFSLVRVIESSDNCICITGNRLSIENKTYVWEDTSL